MQSALKLGNFFLPKIIAKFLKLKTFALVRLWPGPFYKSSIFVANLGSQGAKKIIFTACHSGKLKLAFTSPDIISTSPKNFLISRIDFTVLLLFEFLKKHHWPIGQVKNRIH